MKTVCHMSVVTPFILLFLLFVAYGLFPISSAQGGDIINVPADYPTIQSAINTATTGDIIIVAPGTYFETIDFLGKGITLKSSGDPSGTIINGQGNGSVVQCVNGEGADTVLEGFTITGGDAEVGGGMLNIGSSPTINDCKFTGNYAGDRGGGMYNSQGNPTVNNSTFDGNTAVAMGGGMFNLEASPTVTGCSFTQNISNKGAGMRNYLNSHPTVTDSFFLYNDAGEEGGGMDNRKNSNPMVTGCIFEGNTALSGGGGMHNYVGKPDATEENPVIINCLFINNSAPSGGGIRNNDPDPIIINTTIAYNDGSGISSRNGSAPVIKNSIVWGNSGGSFDGASSHLSMVSYSDIEGGFDGDGNLDTFPMFVNPAENDYHLLADSPLIDAGDIDDLLPDTDLDGKPRIIGDTVDMGAYESADSCSEEDNDGDGYTPCDGDCDDSNININPGVVVDDCDGIDNNCNGIIDDGVDEDNDGYTTCGGDCNDSNPDIYPLAHEICNDDIDNNCNGTTDEEIDSDYDGFYNCVNGLVDDCDDSIPGINPSAAEICMDGFDNDCDGDIDSADSECATLLPKGAPCSLGSDCLSNKCKGKPGNMTCR